MSSKVRGQNWLMLLGALSAGGGVLFYGPQFCERQAIRSVLGAQATAAQVNIFVRSGSGRLDYVTIELEDPNLVQTPNAARRVAPPVTESGIASSELSTSYLLNGKSVGDEPEVRQASATSPRADAWSSTLAKVTDAELADRSADAQALPSKLSADKLWFTYDFAALLRKKFVFPKMVLEGVEIQLSGDRARSSNNPSVAFAWGEQLVRLSQELHEPGFLNELDVMQLISSTSEQWHEAFSQLHTTANGIMSDSQKIRNELSTLDNRLRHDEQIAQSLKKLESNGQQLEGLLIEINGTERMLQAHRVQFRESLARDKLSLTTQGASFAAPEPDQFAATMIQEWALQLWQQHSLHMRHVEAMLLRPFASDPAARGTVIDHSTSALPRFAVYDARLTGKLISGKSVTPFSASARFHASTSTDSAKTDPNTDLKSRKPAATYNLSVGDMLAPTLLNGTLDHCDDRRTVSVELIEPNYVEARCTDRDGELNGTMQVKLKPWLELHAASPIELSRNNAQPSAEKSLELLAAVLADAPDVPELIELQISGSWQRPRFEVDEAGYQWLSQALKKQASLHISQEYTAVSNELDANVKQRVDELNRMVAVSRNETQAHLLRMRTEHATLRADVMRHVEQRSDLNFARRNLSEPTR